MCLKHYSFQYTKHTLCLFTRIVFGFHELFKLHWHGHTDLKRKTDLALRDQARESGQLHHSLHAALPHSDVSCGTPWYVWGGCKTQRTRLVLILRSAHPFSFWQWKTQSCDQTIHRSCIHVTEGPWKSLTRLCLHINLWGLRSLPCISGYIKEQNTGKLNERTFVPQSQLWPWR